MYPFRMAFDVGGLAGSDIAAPSVEPSWLLQGKVRVPALPAVQDLTEHGVPVGWMSLDDRDRDRDRHVDRRDGQGGTAARKAAARWVRYNSWRYSMPAAMSPPPSSEFGAPGSPNDTSSARLLDRAIRGDRSAREELFARYLPWLRRWARGRLPRWTRGVVDTSDVVQDALRRTVTRLGGFEPRGDGALRAYLRNAVENRIRDEMRQVARRPVMDVLDEGQPLAGNDRSPLEKAIHAEAWDRYRSALKHLPRRDQRLIVGRLELGYSFAQLAAVDGRAGPDGARMALKRALARLAAEMGADDAKSG